MNARISLSTRPHDAGDMNAGRPRKGEKNGNTILFKDQNSKSGAGLDASNKASSLTTSFTQDLKIAELLAEGWPVAQIAVEYGHELSDVVRVLGASRSP